MAAPGPTLMSMSKIDITQVGQLHIVELPILLRTTGQEAAAPAAAACAARPGCRMNRTVEG